MELRRLSPSVVIWQQGLDVRNPAENSFVSCPRPFVPQRTAVCVLAGFPLPVNQMKMYRVDTKHLPREENQRLRDMTQPRRHCLPVVLREKSEVLFPIEIIQSKVASPRVKFRNSKGHCFKTVVMAHPSPVLCDSHWVSNPNDFLLLSPDMEDFARLMGRRADV